MYDDVKKVLRDAEIYEELRRVHQPKLYLRDQVLGTLALATTIFLSVTAVIALCL